MGRQNKPQYAAEAYRPLPDSKQYMRVLSIRSSSSMLLCDLSIRRLDNPRPYICLSYTWGEKFAPRSIRLAGHEIVPRRNLFVALESLRYHGYVDGVWCDALCINQEDDAEKAEQVKMMGTIYSGAEEVVVWLGDGRPASAPKRDNLHESLRAPSTAGNKVERSMGLQNILERLAQGQHFHELPFQNDCQSLACPGRDDPGIKVNPSTWEIVREDLVAAFDSSWFTRAWTVQEIVLARKATVICGHWTFSWSTIAVAWRNFGKHMRTCCSECISMLPRPDIEFLRRNTDQIVALEDAKTWAMRGQHMIDPLIQFSWKGCEDPRDKLFGLIGLQTSCTPTPVLPDYKTSVQEVFGRFACDLAYTQSYLMPLCLDLSRKVPERENLPSWVPDWEAPSVSPPFYSRFRLAWSQMYRSDSGLPGNAIIDDQNTLVVDGIFVDSIAHISRPCNVGKALEDQLQITDDWQHFINLRERGSRSYPGGGKLRGAFGRTLVADCCLVPDELTEVRHARASDQTVIALNAFRKAAKEAMKTEGASAQFTRDPAMEAHVTAAVNRRLFQTEQGYIGLCPQSARAGDMIFVVGDCPAPIVLQPYVLDITERVRYFRTFGHCYVHGIMDGEAVQMDLPRMRVHIR